MDDLRTHYNRQVHEDNADKYAVKAIWTSGANVHQIHSSIEQLSPISNEPEDSDSLSSISLSSPEDPNEHLIEQEIVLDEVGEDDQDEQLERISSSDDQDQQESLEDVDSPEVENVESPEIIEEVLENVDSPEEQDELNHDSLEEVSSSSDAEATEAKPEVVQNEDALDFEYEET